MELHYESHVRLEKYMKKLWFLFWALCLLVAFPLGWRSWNLRLLYLDTSIRNHVQTTVEAIARKEGWILSDVSLREVRRDSMTITHRRHGRGADPVACYLVRFVSPKLLPCDV